MARYVFQGVFTDQSGNAIEGGTVTPYEADSTTAVTVYAAASGGTSVNSVETDSAGKFVMYFDTSEYSTTQKFDVKLTKTNFTDQTYEDVAPFPALHVVAETSFTFDPADLADGAGETKESITVTGAAFGDYVLVSAPYDLQDIICTGYVQAADTVEVRIQNENAGANVDLASGTWKVAVLRI